MSKALQAAGNSRVKQKEWADFVKALHVLMQRSSPKQGQGHSAYDEIASRDAKYSDEAKGYAPFLAFNLLQLKVFESALQAIDSNIDLPYWDWSFDAAKPQA